MKRISFFKKQKKKRSRGFSLVEVVIAMVVIVAVSASAISIVMLGNQVSSEVYRTFEAQTIVRNAIECFKVTDDYEGKGSTLARTLLFYDSFTGFEESQEDATTKYVKFVFDRPTYQVEVVVFYGAEGERDWLFAHAFEKETNDHLFQTQYVKGDVEE